MSSPEANESDELSHQAMFEAMTSVALKVHERREALVREALEAGADPEELEWEARYRESELVDGRRWLWRWDLVEGDEWCGGVIVTIRDGKLGVMPALTPLGRPRAKTPTLTASLPAIGNNSEENP